MSNHGPHKPGMEWCKYCEVFVVNNPPCIKHHNDTITHRVNVAKYEKRKKKERAANEAKTNEIDTQMAAIRKKAEEQYLKNDVKKVNDQSLLLEHLADVDEVEKAKELYGGDFFENVIIQNKSKINKTKMYNDFMKKLPTTIQAKYRQQIPEFK